MNTIISCDFCENNLLIPKKYIHKYINKYFKTLYKIELLVRISENAYNYMLLNHHQEIEKMNLTIKMEEKDKYYLIKQFLYYDNLTNIPSFIKCDICNKEACMFHFTFNVFIFYKCNLCNKISNICGWCQEEMPLNYYCINCDFDKKIIYL